MMANRAPFDPTHGGQFGPSGPTQRPTYLISPEGESITCFGCGRTSWNLNDVAKKYCVCCDKTHTGRAS